MTKGRWKPTHEALALEAFAVLIKKAKPSRAFSRTYLLSILSEPGVYMDFLKLTLEHDDSEELGSFKKGLLWVVRQVGVSAIAQKTGLSRITLYRMLSPKGNPRFDSLIPVLQALGIRLWIVDDAFINARKRVVRARDERQKVVVVSPGHRQTGRPRMARLAPY